MVVRGKTRVLVVDDHPMVRDFVGQLICREEDMEVCAQAETIDDALEVIASGTADIAVVDVVLRGGNGIELISRALELRPSFPIVMFTAYDEPAVVERAFQVGAKGYVLKHEPSQTVVAALRCVLAGETYLSEMLSDPVLTRVVALRNGIDSSPAEILSTRELQIFQLLGQGMKAGEIAEHLEISVKTVQAHRANIKQKLNLKTGGRLTRYAIQCAMLAT